jgi:hypothetical protein
VKQQRAFWAVIRAIPRNVLKFFRELNDDSIFAIWIAAIFLAGTLIWGLSTRMRDARTMQLANRTLAEAGDSRSLSDPVPAWRMNGPALAAGYWYILNNRELALIFPVFYEGIACPFLAIFRDDGKTGSFIPLSSAAKNALERASGGYMNAYIHHAEKSARQILKKLYGGQG